MFVHQEYEYRADFLEETSDWVKFVEVKFKAYVDSCRLRKEPIIVGYDTETTGLSLTEDFPFLIGFGFGKNVFAMEPSPLLLAMLQKISSQADYLFAHNAQFDYNMMLNLGVQLDRTKLADSMAVARLTQYADVKLGSLSLEALGLEHVSSNAKKGGHVIRQHMTSINLETKQILKEMFNRMFPKANFNDALAAYRARIPGYNAGEPLEKFFPFFDEYYTEANYYSVYLEKPKLVINYVMDDVVIMLEYLKKSIPVLKIVDPSLQTFHRECALIPVSAQMERTGLLADKEYLLSSLKRCLAYQKMLYDEFHLLLGVKLTVMQSHKIGQELVKQFGVSLNTTDVSGEYKTGEKELLACLQQKKNARLEQIVQLIIELRTLDKWISTYIVGKLKSIDKDGRIRTYINNQGAVSGRVSSNLQQQPRDPLLDRNGDELFHPRRVFIAEPDSTLVFIDFNQMELRMQAYYTGIIGGSKRADETIDTNLGGAFLPIGCSRQGVKFTLQDPMIYEDWNTGDWVRPDGSIWEPGDVHAATTFIAFPHLNNDPTHPEFKKYRKLGKMCNFLKNYQGSWKAIVEQMGVSEELAKTLDQAYYKAFPRVKDYQSWVNRTLALQGYVENLFGRRYYMQDAKWYYKAGNYVIQGSCADYMKKVQVELDWFLRYKNVKTKMLLPIHDELVFSVPNDELHLVNEWKAVMEGSMEFNMWMPMLTEVEGTRSSWADKKKLEDLSE